MYATINIQGSCNNLCDTARTRRSTPRVMRRDIAWLQGDLRRATARESAAVMLITQADPGFDGSDVHARAAARPEDAGRDRRTAADGFQDFLVALRDATIAFRKPVAYVHGDSHYFRIDKPLLDSRGQAR